MSAAYLFTFACYGTWLHGDPRGSYSRSLGFVPPNQHLEAYERSIMTETPYRLTLRAGEVVVASIRQVSEYRGWTLHAAHALPDRVLVVAELDMDPAKALGQFKAYASRNLSDQGIEPGRKKRWARSGNCSKLSDPGAIGRAIRHVLLGQGPPMATYQWAGPATSLSCQMTA